MKKVHLVETENFDTKDLLSNLVGFATSNNDSFTVAEIRSAVRILDKLEEATNGEYLELEDSEYNFLHKRVTEANYKVAHRDLLYIIDAVENPE